MARQVDGLVLAEVHLPAERKPSFPVPTGSPCVSLSTSRGSCDLLQRPGEGRCLCSPSACWLVVTGGLFKPQQQLINIEEQPPTGSFFHYPVLKTDSPSLRSQAVCLTAQHPDKQRFTIQSFLLGLATFQKSTEDPFTWATLDHPVCLALLGLPLPLSPVRRYMLRECSDNLILP